MTQPKAQGPSRTYNESKEEEEEVTCLRPSVNSSRERPHFNPEVRGGERERDNQLDNQ